MQSKSLLIAMAAFAVTTSGAQAYSTTILEKANLTDNQRSALDQAKELRQTGDKKGARDVLVHAGIDEGVLHELREVSREIKAEIKTALEVGDYTLFKKLIAGMPLADIIVSKSDFKLFQATQNLRQLGDHEEARLMLDKLGVEKPKRGHRFLKRHLSGQLTEEQREALRVAKQANDRDTVKAILEEAGI